MTALVTRMQSAALIVSALLRSTCRKLGSYSVWLSEHWRDVAFKVRQHWPRPLAKLRSARSHQTGGLFRKYAAFLVALVGGSLLINALIEMYYSYDESRQALSAVQREKAVGAATVIEQFVKEIEGQVGWATGFLPTGSGLEQRRLDFLRLLRQAPAITEVSYIDGDGREQIKTSRLAMDTLASGADLSKEPRFVEAKSNKRYLSPVYFRKESEPYLTLAIAGTGRSAGVTVAEVNLKVIQDMVAATRVGDHGVAFVVDTRGRVIAHSDTGMLLRDFSNLDLVQAAHRTGSIPAVKAVRDVNGRQVLATYAIVARPTLSVFVELPVEEATK